MGSQDIMIASRLHQARALKAEAAALKADNAKLREKLAALEAHFDMALLAADDLRSLSPGGKMLIVDGWNLILGCAHEAGSRKEVVEKARARLESGEYEKAWVVFDGDRENVSYSAAVRVSYTGGEGAQRADRFICDYLRMAKYLALEDKIEVWTNDKAFRKTVEKIKSRI